MIYEDNGGFLNEGSDYNWGVNEKTDLPGTSVGPLMSPEPQQPAINQGSAMKNMGLALSVFGVVGGAIGGFFQAQAQQYQLESQALSLEFQKTIAQLNAKTAESNAQASLLVGQRQIGAVTMQYGQKIGSTKTAMAANGVQLGEGNAKEIIASTELMKQSDAIVINANAVRAASESRMQETNFNNQALMAGVSAKNMRASARSISPFMSGYNNFLTGAGRVASKWYDN